MTCQKNPNPYYIRKLVISKLWNICSNFQVNYLSLQNSISDTLHYEFDLSLEILEEDGSGTPVPVPQDKVNF